MSPAADLRQQPSQRWLDTFSDKLAAQIQAAAEILHAGGVVAYPTEAVYGLGCDPRNPQALQKILKIKQRSSQEGLIILANDVAMLQEYVDFSAIPETNRLAMLATWPGPHTWICPVLPTVSSVLTGRFSTIAVRVSAHPLAAALSQAFGGAIVSTSANLSGQECARTTIDVLRIFDDAIDYILEGAVGGQNKPTEIRDVITQQQIRSA